MSFLDIKTGSGISLSLNMKICWWSKNMYSIGYFLGGDRIVYVGLIFRGKRDLLYLYKFSSYHYGHFKTTLKSCFDIKSGKPLLIFLKSRSVEKVDLGGEFIIDEISNLKSEI